MHLSRGAVLRSSALLVSGLFLLGVAAAGYFLRYVGGELGKALQIEFLFAALLLFALAVFSGSFRSKLKVFVSKHFFAYRYDYREEWLRFTRDVVGRQFAAGHPAAQHPCARRPGREPGWCVCG